MLVIMGNAFKQEQTKYSDIGEQGHLCEGAGGKGSQRKGQRHVGAAGMLVLGVPAAAVPAVGDLSAAWTPEHKYAEYRSIRSTSY